MSPEFQRHAAMVIVFGVLGVIWARSLIYIWRIPYENTIWDRLGRMQMMIVFGPPLAAYFIIKDAW